MSTPRGILFSWTGLQGWSFADLTVRPTSYSPETFTPADDSPRTILDVAEEFIAWANSGSRAWTGAVTFTYAITTQASTAQLGLTLTASTTTTWTPNSQWASNLNTPAGPVGGTDFASGGITTTLYADVSLAPWVPIIPGSGVRGRLGSWRPQVSSHGLRSATVEAVLDDIGCLALSAALASTGTFRRGGTARHGYVWHDAGQAWRKVHIPEVPAPEPTGVGLYRLSFNVREVR